MHPRVGDKSSAPFRNVGGNGFLDWKNPSLPLKNRGRSRTVKKTESLPCFLLAVLWGCHTQVARFPRCVTGRQFFFSFLIKKKKKKVKLKVTIHPSVSKAVTKIQYPSGRFFILGKIKQPMSPNFSLRCLPGSSFLFLDSGNCLNKTELPGLSF